LTDDHKSESDLIHDLRGSRKVAEKAFSEFYNRYGQRVYAFILRMTSDRAASQDLLQETFVKFFHATKQDLVFTNPVGFLMMIARNLCLNWKRDERPTQPLEDILEAGNENHVERDELLNLVTLSLELLEYDHREAFVLKYYQGYSYEEMSVLTGATVTALKKRVWRAKDKIRSALQPYILELKD
jgi:RNA polymerase sigma-70 factor (ECF subfamily)